MAQRTISALLLQVERSPRAVMGSVALFTVAGLATLPFFGGEFLPELSEEHFIVHMSAVPGTSVQESLRLGREVTRELLKIRYIRSVAQRVGRAEKADDVYGTHYGEFEVDLKPLTGEEAEFAQSEICQALVQFLGVNFAVNTFLTERVEETLSGYTAAVVITIFGHDLDVLDNKAQAIAKVLGTIPGATDIRVEAPPGTPQLMVRLRKGDLARWGFDRLEVLDPIRTAYQGDIVGQTYEGNRLFDVAVLLDSQNRKTPADVGALPLRNSAGTYVQLR